MGRTASLVEEAIQREAHVAKVRAARAQVQTGHRPQEVAAHASMRGNRKRDQQRRDRQTDIARENTRLLQRFHEIGTSGSRPRASSLGPRSLNVGQRKKEFDRIQAENQRMLRRLQSVRPALAAPAGPPKVSAAMQQKLSGLNREDPALPRPAIKARAQMGDFEARLQERLEDIGFYEEVAEVDGRPRVPGLDLRGLHGDDADLEGYAVDGENDEEGADHCSLSAELEAELAAELDAEDAEADAGPTDEAEALRLLQDERMKLDFQIAALGSGRKQQA